MRTQFEFGFKTVDGRLHPVRYYAPNTVGHEESMNVEQEMVEFTEQIVNTVFHWWNNGKGDGKNLKDDTLQGMISCIGWAVRTENLPATMRHTFVIIAAKVWHHIGA
jgi:hypothetical protein